MKRPLAVIGFSYTAALWAAFLSDAALLLYFSAAFAAAGILLLIIKKTRKKPVFCAVMLSAAAAFASFSFFTSAYVGPLNTLYGQETIVSGRICELPYEQNGRVYYKLETDEISKPDAPDHTTMLLSSSKALKAGVYDRITAKVRLWKESDERYKGCNISRRIFLRGSIDSYSSVTVEKCDDKPLYYYAVMARKAVIDAVDDQLPEHESSFVCALLTGERSGLSENDRNMFRECGLSHITVVSGFHLSVIVQLFFMAVSVFMKNKRRSSLIAVGFVFVYMGIAGFTPSVMRAGVMQILTLLSTAAFARADSLNSLGLSALIICFINPYTAADAGFLLSMFSTLGIILCSRKIHNAVMNYIPGTHKRKSRTKVMFSKYLYSAADKIISVLSVSISAWLFTLPVTVLFFQSFSVYSVFFNLLVSLPVSLLIFVSLCMVILRISVIFAFLTLPFAVLSGLLCRLIYSVAGIVELLPTGTVNVAFDFVPACMLLCGGISVILLLLRNRRKALRIGAWASVMIFFAASLFGAFIRLDTAKVSVIDVGNGLCVLVDDGADRSLIGCGADSAHGSAVTEYLEKSAVGGLSYLLIPDRTKENSGSAASVLEEYFVGTAHVYDEEKQYEKVHRLLKKADKTILMSGSENEPCVIHNGNTDINVMKSEDGMAVYLRLYQKTFLICFSGTDCSMIPDEWKKADYLILNGIIKNADELSVDTFMISDDGSAVAADAAALSGICDDIYFTGGRGHLFVRLYAHDATAVGRETLWLS